MKQAICNIMELSKSACKEFIAEVDSEPRDAFLIYFNEHYYAYVNSCPHTQINLNWQKEQFFSVDGLFLQCSLHGALFEPSSGLCIRGPCMGKLLKQLKVVVENDIIYFVS